MRDRLIELLDEAEIKVGKTLDDKISLSRAEWLGIYADHLLANNTIAPPCKVGDKVYRITCMNAGIFCGILGLSCCECPYENEQIIEGTVVAFKFIKDMRLKVKFGKMTDYFCKDEIYYTKEEAEKALKGSVRNDSL